VELVLVAEDGGSYITDMYIAMECLITWRLKVREKPNPTQIWNWTILPM
jgi:hypothetical protein